MTQGTPLEYFTPSSILTSGGAMLAVWLVSNTYRALLKHDTVWVAFGMGMLIAFVGASYNNALENGLQLLVAFLNGCLLFCSATGLNETVVDLATPKPAGEATRQGIRLRWLMSWFNNSRS